MLRNIKTLGMVTFGTIFFAGQAIGSSGSRLLQSQGEYLGTAVPLWEVVLFGVIFIMGLAAIGFSGWHMLQDYVFAKADHEKKFSIGKLIVGTIIGSLLCVPYSAILIGGDITGAGPTSGAAPADFKKP